uniref:Uncharacterized protein n=1 Tax=Strongyloides papillosus TaxID=174720 RepID=A0A0N5CH36_STREA
MGSCHSSRIGYYQCRHCRRWCATGGICECRRGVIAGGVLPTVILTNPHHHHHRHHIHGAHFGHHHHHHHC